MKKILIVEDSVLIQTIIQDTIETCFPCEVKAVDDGAKAYNELAGNAYDLVITDIVMPIMDGLTLAEKIRVELGSDVPIIMLTSLGVKNVRDSASATGVNAYLTKPIDTDQLVRVLNRLFPAGDAPDTVEAPQPNIEASSPDVEAPPLNVEIPPPDVETPTPEVDAPSPDIKTSQSDFEIHQTEDEESLPEIEEWTDKIDEEW
jgi:CheY-like chemotaxis protein